METNATGGNASTTGPGQPAASGPPAATLTIPQSASVQGNPAYEPDPLTVNVGDTIAVENKDTTPHTVTNGKDATDPNMGKLFDTSIINAGESSEIMTADLQPDEYTYFCAVHPFMKGILTVQ
jgi:plastocyanin